MILGEVYALRLPSHDDLSTPRADPPHKRVKYAGNNPDPKLDPIQSGMCFHKISQDSHCSPAYRAQRPRPSHQRRLAQLYTTSWSVNGIIIQAETMTLHRHRPLSSEDLLVRPRLPPLQVACPSGATSTAESPSTPALRLRTGSLTRATLSSTTLPVCNAHPAMPPLASLPSQPEGLSVARAQHSSPRPPSTPW